ncbi:MAG: NAD(P)H-hydrate epimerase [Anaerovoracaceae bacterium]
MDYITCGQMKILEKRANASGLSYNQMMENAGTEAADIIANKSSLPICDSNVVIFCGKGNNGGDGLVIARKFYEEGAKLSILFVDGLPATEDSQANFDRLSNMDITIIDMSKNTRPFMNLKAPPDIIVDAIYGTGYSGTLMPNALRAGAYINQFFSSALIIALDVPSGMGGDMLSPDDIDKHVIKAKYTITFHKMKPVHFQKFAKEYCGETVIADIGIDENKLW